MASTDARPVPIKGVAYRHGMHFWKNDSTLLTSITGADTKVSKDNAAFSACTNEFTETGSDGCGYIDLTSTEMNADIVTIKSTCTNTGAVPYIYYLYPEEAGDIRANLTPLDTLVMHSGTAQAGGASTITLASGATATDDLYKGEMVKIYSGTGAGQVRVIIGYVGTTKVATVGRAWLVSPDATSVYAVMAIQSPPLDANLGVKLWTGTSAGMVNVASGKVPATLASTDVTGNVAADLQTIKTQTVTAAAGVTFPTSLASPTNITAATGIVLSGVTHTGAVIPTVTTTGTATAVTTVNGLAANVITATAIASNAITNAKIATGAIASATFAAGAINAAAIATGAIDADALATDAVTEIWAGSTAPAASAIADAVWDEVLSGHLTGGTTGAALNGAGSAGDPWTTTLPGAYGAGTAGKILGDNLNATVGSRSSHSAADVWAAATRTLTAGTNIVLTKGTGVTGFTDLDAGGVRTAVGLASANLDTQIADLPTVAEFNARTILSADYATATNLATVDTVVDAILDDTGTSGVVVAAGSKAGYALSSAGLDSVVVETGLNARQSLSIIAASAAGTLAGAATTTITIDGAGVTTDRISATVDADGNRSAITLTPPA
jgi:hypothetical protein